VDEYEDEDVEEDNYVPEEAEAASEIES